MYCKKCGCHLFDDELMCPNCLTVVYTESSKESTYGYIVPEEIPKYCNKCPFGYCVYSHPFWAGGSISRIDGKENPAGTYGFICNLEFNKNKKYAKVLRNKIGEDINKPEWCRLREVE